MALAPRLELRQSQQLVMTPQLQQAIKLLQLSNLELAEFVEQQLEENPFLERASEEEPRSERGAERSPDGAEPVREDERSVRDIDLTRPDAQEAAQDAIDPAFVENENGPGPDGPGVDGYRSNEWAGLGDRRGGFDGDGREPGETAAAGVTLHEHLTNQLHVATSDPELTFIAANIIDVINDAGYLGEDLGAMGVRLGAERARMEEALRIVQTFDPSGVGARDLKECLRLQLQDRDRFDPAMARFIDNIELLAKGDLKGLIRATQADEEDVRDMIAEVRGLNPKPGYAYGSDFVQVVAPDVFVSERPDGGWRVELNSETLPKVLVNQTYFAEVSKGKTREEDAAYAQEKFANASWLVKSLDQRARTILKVAEEIVRQQDAFLVQGVRALKPLNLKTVADAIEMHESTVSRVTSNKYVATPRGIFELKYFFTASIASSAGGEAHSAEAVRHRIRTLINAETAESILSDDRIVEILRTEGVDIARRTVAKYRETMGIASSVQRRRAALQAAI